MCTSPTSCAAADGGYRDPRLRPIAVRPQQVRRRQHDRLAEIEPDRPMLGHDRIRLDRRQCRRPDDARRAARRACAACSASTCRSSPAAGRARMRCAGSTGRTPARPSGTAPAGCCWSATPPMCTRAMGGPGLNLGHAGRGEPRLEAGRRGQRLGAGGSARHLRVRALSGGGAGDDALAWPRLALDGPGPEVAALRDAFRRAGSPYPMSPTHMARTAGRLRRPLRRRRRPSAVRADWCPTSSLDDGRRVAELLHDARPVLLDLSGGSGSGRRGTRGPTGWTS